MNRTLVVFIAALAVVALPIVATAHNAGHVVLPDGTCQDLGSGHDAPLVGQDRTQLDLVPESARDQLGVSFVGVLGLGNSPVLPGFCLAHTASAAADYNNLDGVQVSYQ